MAKRKTKQQDPPLFIDPPSAGVFKDATERAAWYAGIARREQAQKRRDKGKTPPPAPLRRGFHPFTRADRASKRSDSPYGPRQAGRAATRKGAAREGMARGLAGLGGRGRGFRHGRELAFQHFDHGGADGLATKGRADADAVVQLRRYLDIQAHGFGFPGSIHTP